MPEAGCQNRGGGCVSRTLAAGSDLAEACAVAHEIAEFCRQHMPSRLRRSFAGSGIELTITEVLTNIVRHAYGLYHAGPIFVEALVERQRIKIVVRDHGRELPFGRLMAKSMAFEPDDTENLPEGGFGWPLIVQQMDDVHYCRKDGENLLVMIKELGCPDSNAPCGLCLSEAVAP